MYIETTFQNGNRFVDDTSFLSIRSKCGYVTLCRSESSLGEERRTVANGKGQDERGNGRIGMKMGNVDVGSGVSRPDPGREGAVIGSK